MAVLTSKARNALPKSEFGIPSERKYPMEDWQHAADAKSRARRQLTLGHISKSEYDEIAKKADAVIAKHK